MVTHRPLSTSFMGLPYRILNIYHKKELLRGLWVGAYSRKGRPKAETVSLTLNPNAALCCHVDRLVSFR